MRRLSTLGRAGPGARDGGRGGSRGSGLAQVNAHDHLPLLARHGQLVRGGGTVQVAAQGVCEPLDGPRRSDGRSGQSGF